MIFSGLQKLSLLDFPGKMCATVFTGGCNFRCPFCHNSSLVNIKDNKASIHIDEEEILSFLKKRAGILEGVCITGGEPTLFGDSVLLFMHRVKDLGLLVKLDTNGSNPDFIKKAVGGQAVDYIAMDIKSSVENYSLVTGTEDIDLESVMESANYLMEGHVDFEFRTTIVKPLHKVSDFESIGMMLAGDEKFFIQCYKDSGDILFENDSRVRNKLIESVSLESCDSDMVLTSYSEDEMKSFLEILKKYIPRAEIRGI